MSLATVALSDTGADGHGGGLFLAATALVSLRAVSVVRATSRGGEGGAAAVVGSSISLALVTTSATTALGDGGSLRLVLGGARSMLTLQGVTVSMLPQRWQVTILAAASASAAASGSSRSVRRFSSASAALRAERVPSPGSRPRHWISRSISGPAIFLPMGRSMPGFECVRTLFRGASDEAANTWLV